MLLNTASTVVQDGSISQIWGAINGMQIASYFPIVNIAFAENAAEFSGSVAAIVTFDIPGVDMEFVF